MKMKKIITAVLAVMAVSQASGQALKTGFEHLRNQRYNDAAKIFMKALDKGTETMAANYGLGCVLSSPEYDNANTVKGFRMIRNANDRYMSMPAKTKTICRDIYGFGYNEIHAKMLEVAGRELQAIAEQNSVESYEWYIATFDGADSLVAEARKRESEIVWPSTQKAGSFRAYKDFADKFPNTPHAAEATRQYRQVWEKLCRQAFGEGELQSMEAFKNKYPNYPFYTDVEKNEYKLAQEAYNLKLNLRYSQDYEPYYKAYIEKAAPCQLAYVALLRIISPYIEMARYAEAADILDSYSDKFPGRSADIAKTSAMLRASGRKYTSTPLPPAINTEHMEYAPVMTPDGNTLYFCGNGREDNAGMEDIFVSHKAGGQWQKAQPMSQFNTPMSNEAPLAISPDGNTILIYKDANIFYSERRGGGWSPLKKMPGLNTGTSWDADASFTPDGNAIFFISDRQGNVGQYHPHEKLFHGSYHGNSDIYVSTRNSDGTWSDPVNIGATINTPYAERSPWLASDMKTLYFSSDGHYGLGMLDAYKATRLSDSSWTEWSEPVNLGKEINTAQDDYNYVISTDGTSALFTKVQRGTLNICTVDLPEQMRPEAIGIVLGKVTDYAGNSLEASIKWEDLHSGKILGTLKCDPATGSYFITLPAGRNYGYFVEMDGYYPVSGNLNTENLKTGKNLERNIVMNSIKDIMEGKVSIILENIFFDTNKYELKPESYPELRRLAKFVSENPGAMLEISGHTDNSGQLESNKTLSQRRADSVRQFLIENGCGEDQIRATGYGPDKPIDSNATEKGKARNRRVEFRIMGNH